MKAQRLGGWLATVVVVGFLRGGSGIDAQMVLESPAGEPQAGQVVELSLPSPDPGLEIHAVRLGDRSVPFEVVESGGDRPLRIRVRLPEDLEPGDHEISALYAETRIPVPDVRGLTLEEARRRLEDNRLEPDPASLGEIADGDSEKILSQTPAAGATVAAGTRVAMVFEAPAGLGWFWPVVVASAAAAGAAAMRARKKKRRKKKQPEKIQVTANQDLAALRASVKVTAKDGGSQPGARPAAEPAPGSPAVAAAVEGEDEAENFTIGSLFFPQEEEEDALEEGEGLDSLETSLEEELPDTPFKAVKTQISAKIHEALEIGLSELLGPAWEKLQIFREYFNPEDPNEPIPIPLAGHAIESSHAPSVEIKVKGVKLGEIELAVDLALTLDGLVLELLGDKIVTLRAGSCVISGCLAGSLAVKGVSTDLMSFEKEIPEIRLRGLDLAIVIPYLRERLGR